MWPKKEESIPETEQGDKVTSEAEWNFEYMPVSAHWFYRDRTKKGGFAPFNVKDSARLEIAHTRGSTALVTTDGGRYDVNVQERSRISVYWEETPSLVLRATWFYRDPRKGSGFLPFDEESASKLEEAYRLAIESGRWNHVVSLGKDVGSVTMFGPTTMVYHEPETAENNSGAVWGSNSSLFGSSGSRTSPVHRGMDHNCELGEEIELVEPGEIDHLVFVIHGIGGICDLTFRDISEVLLDVRKLSSELIQIHFPLEYSQGIAGRVEYLPICWHKDLHSYDLESLFSTITLPSISKIRDFINGNLVDILLYTSPFYCENILYTVAKQLNESYNHFLERNPSFKGTVSIIGHSLGSVIIFDLLAHQRSMKYSRKEAMDEIDCKDSNFLEKIVTNLNLGEYHDKFKQEKIDSFSLLYCTEQDLISIGIPDAISKKIVDFVSAAKEDYCKKKHRQRSILGSDTFLAPIDGSGIIPIIYPRLAFNPTCFFALGSPIGMFLAFRGFQAICENYCLPTCPWFFNIFHPFDPVAYRIETMIDPAAPAPAVVPHHKGGRRRLHSEIRDSISRMGTEIRDKVVGSFRRGVNSTLRYFTSEDESTAEDESSSSQQDVADHDEPQENVPQLHKFGNLNQGLRVDYVLQKRAVEILNEYFFVINSHTCYWDSEDTFLFILSKIYEQSGLKPSFGEKGNPVWKILSDIKK